MAHDRKTLCWTIAIYTGFDDTLVSGILHLIYYKQSGQMWVEITSPYSGIHMDFLVRGGSIVFRNKWVDMSDGGSGVTVMTLLEFIYRQCRRFDEMKDEIGKMYFEYLQSDEYEMRSVREIQRREIYGEILELEEKMDLENPHDPYWKDHDELWINYQSLPEESPVPLVEKIREEFGVEGERGFVIDLIRKFVDSDCNWV